MQGKKERRNKYGEGEVRGGCRGEKVCGEGGEEGREKEEIRGERENIENRKGKDVIAKVKCEGRKSGEGE